MDILVQLIFNGLIAGAIYGLIALGFNLAYGTAKFFNLAHGALAAVGGYGAFYVSRRLGLSILIGALAGVLIAGILGWLLNRFIYDTLRARKASNTVLLIASLGAFTVIQAIIAILFTSQFQTLSPGISNVYEVLGGIVTENQVRIAAITIILSVLLFFFLRKTITGRMITAIADDEEAAVVIGIPVRKIMGYVFFIASAIAGLGGIMVGIEVGLEPTMGMSLLLKGVIASIIGGIGNVYGGVLGGVLLGLIENLGIWKISAEWKDAIAFGILIIFLLIRPQGILRRK